MVIGSLSLRVSDVVVSFSPGALDAMMMLALALQLDPIFVGAHHVARFLLISAALPLFVRMFAQRPPSAAKPRPKSDLFRKIECYSAASARLSGKPSRSQTSTKASASASIRTSSW